MLEVGTGGGANDDGATFGDGTRTGFRVGLRKAPEVETERERV